METMEKNGKRTYTIIIMYTINVTEEATNEQATDWLEGQREISCLYTYVTVFA